MTSDATRGLPAAAIAFVQVLRARGLRSTTRALWGLAVIFLPLIGPLAWFMNRPPDTDPPPR